jgi:Secretion system C-terminal sorting domain
VTVPGTTPTFAFVGPNGECGATFALNNTLEPVSPTQPQPALQWKRENPAGSGIFVPIPGETGTVLSVQPPFRRLQLEANYGSCGAKASILDPPAGLADFSLTSPDAFSPICANSNQEFTAVARFCGATAADAWEWFSGGAIQFTSPPVNGVFTSSIKFIVVGSGFGSITAQKGNTQSNPLSFDVLQFPSCEFLLRKPKDDNTVLPTSVKSESDKIAITDEPNADLKTENTEGVALGSDNKSTIKAKIYPNPATNEIVIEDLQEAKSIRIFDVTGNFKEQINVGEQSTMLKVNTSKYTNGMYLIQIQNNVGEVTTQKVQILK